MKTSDRREINRMINNPFGTDGLYVWPDNQGVAQAGYQETQGRIVIEGTTEVGISTKTKFLECVKTSSSSTIANYYFKTTVNIDIQNREVRQEQYWKMLGISRFICS